MTRTAAVMWAAAGLLGLVIVALPHGPDFRPLGIVVPGVLAIAYAAVLFARGDRLPLFIDHFSALGGAVFTSVGAWASGSLSPGIAMVYVWAGIFSFLFFTRRIAFTYVALMSVGYGVVVATAPGNDAALSRWLLVTVGVSLTAVVVSGLIEEIRRLAAAAGATAAEKSRLIAAAERRREYLQSLIHSSPTAIVAMDGDDRVQAWNPAAERLFGYKSDEAIGRPIDDLVARSDELRGEAGAASGRRPPRRSISSHAAPARTARSSTSSCSSRR